jgi:hypothetical protein
MVEATSHIDVKHVLRALSVRRPIFHSEADFQHELAWTIRELYPDARVRMEVPMRIGNRRANVDLLVQLHGKSGFFELKYKTKSSHLIHNGEDFFLSTHGARDHGQYDSLKDIQRLEEFVGRVPESIGVAIVLSNDALYWSEARRDTNLDTNFKLADGRVISGSMSWPKHAGEGSVKGRKAPIELRGTYTLAWTEYAADFRALIVTVDKSWSP